MSGKIKKLIKDPTDSYVEISNSHRVYMSPISKRKEVTAETQVLSFRDLFLKVDELAQIIDELRGAK